jgi:hypothetical protein
MATAAVAPAGRDMQEETALGEELTRTALGGEAERRKQERAARAIREGVEVMD